MSGFDCAPFLTGNAETVVTTAPAAGTYYIMLHGYAAYSSVSLRASYKVTMPLTNGVSVAGLSGSTETQRFYPIIVPLGASNLQITTSGGTGDVDLYVKRNELSSASVFDCRPFGGKGETCAFPSPAPVVYFVRLRARAAYSSITLRASFSGGTLVAQGEFIEVADLHLRKQRRR